jgi:hypothetical protein
MKIFNRILLIAICHSFLVSCGEFVISETNQEDENSNANNSDEIKEIIPYHFVVDDVTLPEEWKTKNVSAKAISLDPKEIQRSKKIMNVALEKYPSKILEDNLTKIYVLKYLEFFGQKFGGTNSKDVIYLANQGKKNGYDDAYIEQGFHHEFSSILLRNYSDFFSESAWGKFNKLPYGKSGVDALRDDTDSQELNSKLAKKGFLHQYSISTMENDFNAFAEKIFKPTNEFYEFVDKYPIIKHKYNLTVEFYSKIDNSFTLDFFQKLPRD